MTAWNLIPIGLALVSIALAVWSWRLSVKARRLADRSIALLTPFLPGCCTSCGGLGVTSDAPETGGRCWDCKGTGHPHVGACVLPWERRARLEHAARLVTRNRGAKP
jgi:hypothetical protein